MGDEVSSEDRREFDMTNVTGGSPLTLEAVVVEVAHLLSTSRAPKVPPLTPTRGRLERRVLPARVRRVDVRPRHHDLVDAIQ